MSGAIVALLLAAGMFATIWLAARKRAVRPTPGQLSAAERRRLYRRLGLDPAAMARRPHPRSVWRDPNVVDRRRTRA